MTAGGSTYRAAVVGCGRIGCGFDDDPKRTAVSTHAKAYAAVPGFELVALADADGERAALYASRYGCASYVDADRLFARERLDVVSICTPNDTHREIAEAAVAAGVRAVFCEKPLADTLAAADAIVDRCREQDVLLLVDHQRRFDPLHQKAAALIRDGGLGEPQQATCYYTAGIANTGTHLLDLLRLLLGEATTVRAFPSRAESPNPADPNFDGWIEFHSRATAALQALDVAAYTIFEISILGTGGRLRLTGHGYDVEWEVAAPSERFGGYRELRAAPAPFDRPGEPEFMLSAMEHLRDCLDGGAEPLSSGEDGRAALELVIAMHESAAGGRQISLPVLESPLVVASR